jgi:flagellar assembly protein FliH
MTSSSEARAVSRHAAPFALLGRSAGFRPHPRLAPLDALPLAEPSGSDPVEEARAHGFADGFAQGHAEAMAEACATIEAHGRLSLAFGQLDHAMAEDLRLALRETVIALCEGALAPLAIDQDALIARIDRALAMLARSYDDRTIRLNPDDIALISDRLRAEWSVQADASLPRGTLRVESGDGGIEDGPETWRRAIAETLGPC